MFYTLRNTDNATRSCSRLLAGACLLVLPLLFACSHDEGTDTPSAPDTGEHSNLTLVLNVCSDPSSRASDNPMGGEDGNGLRVGEHHENDIENLCVFAFDDENQYGVTGLDGNTAIKYRRYVDNINFHPSISNTFTGIKVSTEVQMQFEGKIVGEYDAFLVVANVGDITTSVNNLGDIRDMVVSKTIKRPATANYPMADVSEFAMANAHNSTTISGSGTKDNPYKASIDIERITSRVDFWYDPALKPANAPENISSDISLLGYKVVDKYNTDEATNQSGWMYISHIKLVNVAQNNPYVLKRLADAENDVPEYLIDEQHVSDEAVKYVVEPNTWSKGKAGVNFQSLYGDTRIENVTTTSFVTREAVRNYATPQTDANSSDGFNSGWSTDRISGEAYYVLDYINENTVEKEHTNGRNTTALVLKTKFVPKGLFSVKADNPGVLECPEAKYGQTFWAMEVLDNTGNPGRRNKLYFKDMEAINLFRALNPSWTTAEPVEYPNGDCYYTVWIRHDNNNDDARIGKMEYGIVRNNIYRIGVSKVVGPGSPTPVATENPEDINLHIYVRKWNFMEVPTINI